MHPDYTDFLIKRFKTPDEVRTFEKWRFELIQIGGMTIGRAARNLPPDEQERFVQRAMKRCSRQKWLAKSEQAKADAVVMSPTALSANVRKGSDVLNEVLEEDSSSNSDRSVSRSTASL
jgi:hypothetical protein